MLYAVVAGKLILPNEALAERVAEISRKSGWGFVELARRLKVAHRTLQHWASGNTWRIQRRHLYRLVALERELGKRPDKLPIVRPLCEHPPGRRERVNKFAARCGKCGMLYVLFTGKERNYRLWIASTDPRAASLVRAGFL